MNKVLNLFEKEKIISLFYYFFFVFFFLKTNIASNEMKRIHDAEYKPLREQLNKWRWNNGLTRLPSLQDEHARETQKYLDERRKQFAEQLQQVNQNGTNNSSNNGGGGDFETTNMNSNSTNTITNKFHPAVLLANDDQDEEYQLTTSKSTKRRNNNGGGGSGHSKRSKQ